MNRECIPSVLVLTALTLAACGEKERAQPPPSPAATAAPAAAVSIDACQLLTKQEVEAALGKTGGEAVPEASPQVFGCRWAAASGPGGASVSVVVYDSPAQALAGFEMALKINDYDQIAGVGDRAYTSPTFGITALKGRYELSVEVTLSQGDQRAAAKRLAEQALTRLPG